MNKNGCIFLIFTLLLSFNCLSQLDSNYVQEISNLKNISLHTTAKNFRIKISTEQDRMAFNNVNLGLGFRIRYKGAGLSLSIPYASLSKSEVGKSFAGAISFHVYPDRFFLNGGIKYFRGFDGTISKGNQEFTVFRPDDKMVILEFMGHYIFDADRFSLRSAFKMVNKQIKSKGSWILSLPITYHNLHTDSLRLNTDANGDFVLNDYRAIKIGLGGGYGYTQVFKDLSLTAVVSAGAELRHLYYFDKYEERQSTQLVINPLVKIFSSIVYDREKYFYALVGTYLPASETIEGLNTRVRDWKIRFLVGRRF